MFVCSSDSSNTSIKSNLDKIVNYCKSRILLKRYMIYLFVHTNWQNDRDFRKAFNDCWQYRYLHNKSMFRCFNVPDWTNGSWNCIYIVLRITWMARAGDIVFVNVTTIVLRNRGQYYSQLVGSGLCFGASIPVNPAIFIKFPIQDARRRPLVRSQRNDDTHIVYIHVQYNLRNESALVLLASDANRLWALNMNTHTHMRRLYYATMYTATRSKACVCVSVWHRMGARMLLLRVNKRVPRPHHHQSNQDRACECICVHVWCAVSSVNRARNTHHGGNAMRVPTYTAGRTCGVPAGRRLIGHML